MDLVVLGAGPAGLGAAYRAARAGRSVVVLERSDRVGGAAGSFDVAGVRVDHGSHRLHPSTPPAIFHDLRDLLGSDLQRRPRNGRIRLGNRWVGFPLQPVDAARSLGWPFLARVARDTALSPVRRPRADTYAEHLRAGLGPTLCDEFYFPYARKLWGLEPEELSAEQARRRVSADGPVKIARKMLRRGDGEGRVFYYPRRGFGQLSERLADAAVGAGADLRLGASVEAVAARPDGVTVGTADGGTVEAGLAWSTIPLTVLARMTEPAPPPEVAAAAAGLRSRALVLIYLVVAGDRYTSFDAHYVPSDALAVSRLSEPKNYRAGGADDPADRSVLCAEVPCSPDDAVWSASDDDAASLVVDTLRACGLPEPRLLGCEVRRLPQAYPIYDRGFEGRFAALDDWVSSLPRLLTFGRQGLFAHDNTHHALAMAWAASDALAPDGGIDRARWAAARARFLDHVVED